MGIFNVGFNDGADLLRGKMDILVERHACYIECWDDVTGLTLDVKLLRQSRALEMQLFDRMRYAEIISKCGAKARGGKVIQGF